MTAEEIEAGYQDPNNDQITKFHFKNTRRPTLTLRHLNQLKKMRAAKDLENLMRADTLDIMYANPSGEEGGGSGF